MTPPITPLLLLVVVAGAVGAPDEEQALAFPATQGSISRESNYSRPANDTIIKGLEENVDRKLLETGPSRVDGRSALVKRSLGQANTAAEWRPIPLNDNYREYDNGSDYEEEQEEDYDDDECDENSDNETSKKRRKRTAQDHPRDENTGSEQTSVEDEGPAKPPESHEMKGQGLRVESPLKEIVADAKKKPWERVNANLDEKSSRYLTRDSDAEELDEHDNKDTESTPAVSKRDPEEVPDYEPNPYNFDDLKKRKFASESSNREYISPFFKASVRRAFRSKKSLYNNPPLHDGELAGMVDLVLSLVANNPTKWEKLRKCVDAVSSRRHRAQRLMLAILDQIASRKFDGSNSVAVAPTEVADDEALVIQLQKLRNAKKNGFLVVNTTASEDLQKVKENIDIAIQHLVAERHALHRKAAKFLGTRKVFTDTEEKLLKGVLERLKEITKEKKALESMLATAVMAETSTTSAPELVAPTTPAHAPQHHFKYHRVTSSPHPPSGAGAGSGAGSGAAHQAFIAVSSATSGARGPSPPQVAPAQAQSPAHKNPEYIKPASTPQTLSTTMVSLNPAVVEVPPPSGSEIPAFVAQYLSEKSAENSRQQLENAMHSINPNEVYPSMDFASQQHQASDRTLYGRPPVNYASQHFYSPHFQLKQASMKHPYLPYSQTSSFAMAPGDDEAELKDGLDQMVPSYSQMRTDKSADVEQIGPLRRNPLGRGGIVKHYVGSAERYEEGRPQGNSGFVSANYGVAESKKRN